MDLKEFVKKYQESQLQDADELTKWAAEKVQAYSTDILEVINGNPRMDLPFIITALEIVAKGMRQQSEEASELANKMERIFGAIITRE